MIYLFMSGQNAFAISNNETVKLSQMIKLIFVRNQSDNSLKCLSLITRKLQLVQKMQHFLNLIFNAYFYIYLGSY